MPKFKSLVDLDLLYDIAKNNKERSNVKKLLQESDLITTDRRIMEEAHTKLNELHRIVKDMSAGKLDYDVMENVVPEMISWADENVVKTRNKNIWKILKKMKYMAKSIMSRGDVGKMEKAGIPGRSGRQKGYRFDATKHPRDESGQFKPKGKSGKGKKGQEYRVTETGRLLPHYDIVEGKRVGRGIQRVPERFTPAMARIGGHIVSSAIERATGEPIKAGQMAASRVRSKHKRELGVREALQRELASPKTSAKDKKKIVHTLETMERRRFKSTGRAKPTNIGRIQEQLKEGLKAGAKSMPYSLTVGAIQGALRGLVERFRTHPVLAPLDIRVRPDILESGLRAGVAALQHRNIDRVREMTESAKESGRLLSPEEYGQIASLLKLPKNERNSIVTMAQGLASIAEKARLDQGDMENIYRIEQQLDEAIGDYMAADIVREIKRNLPSAANRQIKRTKAKADIPSVEITSKDKGRAKELYEKLKSKREKGKK